MIDIEVLGWGEGTYAIQIPEWRDLGLGRTQLRDERRIDCSGKLPYEGAADL